MFPPPPALTSYPKITDPHLLSENEKYTEVLFSRLHDQVIIFPLRLEE